MTNNFNSDFSEQYDLERTRKQKAKQSHQEIKTKCSLSYQETDKQLEALRHKRDRLNSQIQDLERKQDNRRRFLSQS